MKAVLLTAHSEMRIVPAPPAKGGIFDFGDIDRRLISVSLKE